jgi:hypothetical protein
LSNGKLAESFRLAYSWSVNRTLPRLAVILAVMVAWAFASNHCALATLAAATDGHACCHRADQAPDRETMTECCQALNAPLPAVASAPVGFLHALFPAWSETKRTLCPAPTSDPAPRSTHGPPGVIAFAEQVLNRSLLAHAPPVVVS